jgi:Na+/melibiose symporter-like transporter
MTVTAKDSAALRRVLLLDATASGGMGAILAIAATALEPVLGLPAALLRGVGVLLIPFAAFLIWLAPRAGELRSVVRAVAVGNVLWIVASMVVLVSGRLPTTPMGTFFICAQAVAVAVFAYLEHRALARAVAAYATSG